MNIEQKIKILLKPFWNYRDIMNYLNISSTTAYKIIAKCDNKIEVESNLVTSESVLKLFKTTREKELKLLSIIGGIINEY